MPVALALADRIHSRAGSAAVRLIAQQRVPRVLCMYPDLVRAPRLQPPLQQGCSAPGQWLQQLPCAHSMPAPAQRIKSSCMGLINWLIVLHLHQYRE